METNNNNHEQRVNNLTNILKSYGADAFFDKTTDEEKIQSKISGEVSYKIEYIKIDFVINADGTITAIYND